MSTIADMGGRPLYPGNTVQRVCQVGTNMERPYGQVVTTDDTYAYVQFDRWYDVHGNGHDVDAGVAKVHPELLRKVHVHSFMDGSV